MTVTYADGLKKRLYDVWNSLSPTKAPSLPCTLLVICLFLPVLKPNEFTLFGLVKNGVAAGSACTYFHPVCDHLQGTNWRFSSGTPAYDLSACEP